MGCFEYSLIEMAFVVGQGVEGFRTGGDKSRIDTMVLEHQGGT